MHRTLRIVPVLLSVVTVALFAADKQPHVFTGKVVQIAEGDIITVLDAENEKHKVRLLGIDAPEVGHGKGEPGQPYGTKSKEFLERHIDGKQVRVVWRERDQYKRILGDVYVAVDGVPGVELWVNQDSVSRGLAWHFSPLDKRQALAEAEREARQQKLGLWRDSNPIPPWEWRREEREAKNAK